MTPADARSRSPGPGLSGRWDAASAVASSIKERSLETRPLTKGVLEAGDRRRRRCKAEWVGGAVAVVPPPFDGCYVSSGIRSSKVTGQPASRLLRWRGAVSSSGRNLIEWRGGWSHRRRINRVSSLRAEIVPPLDEQAAIARQIASVVALSNRRRASVNHTGALVAALNQTFAGLELNLHPNLVRNDGVAEESEADHSNRVLDVRSRLNIGGLGSPFPLGWLSGAKARRRGEKKRRYEDHRRTGTAERSTEPSDTTIVCVRRFESHTGPRRSRRLPVEVAATRTTSSADRITTFSQGCPARRELERGDQWRGLREFNPVAAAVPRAEPRRDRGLRRAPTGAEASWGRRCRGAAPGRRMASSSWSLSCRRRREQPFAVGPERVALTSSSPSEPPSGGYAAPVTSNRAAPASRRSSTCAGAVAAGWPAGWPPGGRQVGQQDSQQRRSGRSPVGCRPLV